MYRPNRRDEIIIVDNNEEYYSDNGESESEGEGEGESIDSDYEDIFHQDEDYLDKDKENGHYYIGLRAYIPSRQFMLLTNTISIPTFFRHSVERISGYLSRYSLIKSDSPAIDIIKLRLLKDDSYSVVLKTHWLRLIQRNWKRVYQERQQILINRCTCLSLQYREISGRYPFGLNNIPGLRGMLSSLIKTH
jgi:hypothetical protein